MVQDLPVQRDVWAAHYATAHGLRFWPAEELVRSVSRRPAGTVALEAGCGNGANLWFLAEHYGTVVGVDGCQEALEAAEAYMVRRGTKSAVRLCQADLRAMPEASGSADLVVDVMTSQHLPWTEHWPAYAEYRRVLRPGGRLFLQHLSAGSSDGGATLLDRFTYDHLPELFPGVGPVCLPPERRLQAVLQESGFDVDEIRLLVKSYPAGAMASYLVMEATAV